MKKILSVLMISSLLLSFSACGTKNDATDAPEASETEAAVENVSGTEAKKQSETKAESDETAADETKKVYWATKDKDSSDVAYHTKDCTIIKDKDPEELPWEIINTLGMPACEICKP